MGVKLPKTNAMRLLDAAKMEYEERMYDISDELIDGKSVCQKLGLPPEQFYKTLVTRGKSGQLYIFVIPVGSELDLKKAAAVVGEKNIAPVAVRELLALTGYIRGGCSPVGMKKRYITVFDKRMMEQEHLFVSGGRKGLLIGIKPDNLLQVTQGKIADLCSLN